jgi:hypothetical protein
MILLGGAWPMATSIKVRTGGAIVEVGYASKDCTVADTATLVDGLWMWEDVPHNKYVQCSGLMKQSNSDRESLGRTQDAPSTKLYSL